MATIPAVPNDKVGANDVRAWTWTLGPGDDGQWINPGILNDRCAQCAGTSFGGTTIAWEGSNETAPIATTVGFPLTDQNGLPLSFTAAGGGVMAAAALWVRPKSTGGAGSSVPCILVAR